MSDLNQQEQVALLYEASLNQAEVVQKLIRELNRIPDNVASDTSKTIRNAISDLQARPAGFPAISLAFAFAMGVIVGFGGYFFLYEPKATVTLDPEAVAKHLLPELKKR